MASSTRLGALSSSRHPIDDNDDVFSHDDFLTDFEKADKEFRDTFLYSNDGDYDEKEWARFMATRGFGVLGSFSSPTTRHELLRSDQRQAGGTSTKNQV